MRALLLISFLLCSFALLARTSGVHVAEPIRIGVSGPFTGTSAPMGVSMRDGVRLAAEAINRAGGVLGRPVELVERDDEGRNERGVQIAQELVGRGQVVATLGYVNTGVALASQRFYQQARIPVITNVATGSPITRQFDGTAGNYIFRNAAPDDIQVPMMVEDALVRRGLHRLAIFADSTPYGQIGRHSLEQELARYGVQAVAVEKFNLRDLDMTAQLLRARQAGAEAILTYGIGSDLAQVANGMTRLGWKVPMIGSWTLSTASFIDNAGPGAEGASMPQTFLQDDPAPQRAAFVENYLHRFQPKNGRIDAPAAAAQGHDSLLLLVAAIAQAGSTEGPRIKAALENLQAPVEGAVTTYRRPFTPDDHEAIKAGIATIGEVNAGRVKARDAQPLVTAAADPH
jgi:branched-chain amino acid transport system substrate-binding protein